MKRKLSVIVLVAMVAVACLGVLVACNSEFQNEAYKAMFVIVNKEFDKAQGRTSFTLLTSVNYEKDDNKLTCNINWEADNGVTIENGKVTVPQGVTSYSLKATLVDENNKKCAMDGNPIQKTVDVTAAPIAGTEKSLLDQVKEAAVSAPAAGTNYVLAMYQGTLGKVLYATATLENNFIVTTESISSAATVTVETASGGFYIALTANNVKKYITLEDNTNGAKNTKTKIVLTDSATTVYSVGQDNMLLAPFSGSKFMLSTHGSYDTISSNSDFYINDSNGAYAIDISQFIARLIPANTTITAPSDNTDNNSGNTGNTGTTTDKATLSVDGKTVTFDMTNYENASDFTTLTFDAVTLTAAKAQGASAPKFYTENARLYAKNTLTVFATKTIKSVTITFSDKDNGVLSSGSAAVSSGAAVNVNGTSVTFSVSDKGQIRITQIVVELA